MAKNSPFQKTHKKKAAAGVALFCSVRGAHFFKRCLRYSSYSSSVIAFTLFFFAMGKPRRLDYRKYSPRRGIYSVRRAMTGSFFAAFDAGMSPEMRVRATLTQIMMNAVSGCSEAMPAMPVYA